MSTASRLRQVELLSQLPFSHVVAGTGGAKPLCSRLIKKVAAAQQARVETNMVLEPDFDVSEFWVELHQAIGTKGYVPFRTDIPVKARLLPRVVRIKSVSMRKRRSGRRPGGLLGGRRPGPRKPKP